MTSILRAGITLVAMVSSLAPALGQERPRDVGNRVPRTEISSVTHDFVTGIKTTILSDGNVYEEGFDPIKMRRIASRPGADGVVGSR